jgi:hypothetical protein
MYHYTVTYQVSQEKQRDMLAEADRERRARQARLAPASESPRRRAGRRAWQLARSLRTQAQS